VEGGSCNDYDYVCGDPINGLDLTGLFCLAGENPNRSCRGSSVVDEFTDYVGGRDGEKRALDPSYDNRFSNAEHSFVDSSPVKYFVACSYGAATNAPSGALGGPGGALFSAALGCGVGVVGQGFKDATDIPDRTIDAIGLDITAFDTGYSIGKSFILGLVP